MIQLRLYWGALPHLWTKLAGHPSTSLSIAFPHGISGSPKHIKGRFVVFVVFVVSSPLHDACALLYTSVHLLSNTTAAFKESTRCTHEEPRCLAGEVSECVSLFWGRGGGGAFSMCRPTRCLRSSWCASTGPSRKFECIGCLPCGGVLDPPR